MKIRILQSAGDGATSLLPELPSAPPGGGWVWLDIVTDVDEPDELEELAALTATMSLDALAIRDAVADFDLPKVDDFGHHLLVVLHGLRDDRIATYELDCFVTAGHLVTVRKDRSPAVDALWDQVQASPALARGGVDELIGRLAGVLTRRLLSVVEAFDQRIDGLVDAALEADAGFLKEMTAVRLDLAVARRIVHPQREALDVLRKSDSPLLGASGRRWLSDAFDVAVRAAVELDGARAALAETLDAYRGAEAREATNVTKVLTVYAAIMLPLSLVAGFFGMNFTNLPGIEARSGWVIVTIGMVTVAVLSLGIFVALEWIRRPSGRQAGVALGRGLIEAAKAPVHIGGALYEVSAMPLRTISGRRRSPKGTNRPDEAGSPR